MIVLALGMRTEIIKLSGVLVDRGLVTASNPRRQILLNIARMQHYKTGRGGQGSSEFAKWGGKDSSLLNPRSYPCLTIFESYSNPGYSIGREPSGDSRQYRGIIKDLSFRMEGGRPDHWFWNMTFAVVSNEHSEQDLGQKQWLSAINRIRLVDDDDGGGSEVGTGEDGYFEIRSAGDMVLKTADKETLREIEDGDIVYLSNTDSVPTLNGRWFITGINLDNRTFIIKHHDGDGHGEETAIMKNDENEDAGGNESTELKWNEDAFEAGNEGHISWGLLDGTGLGPSVKA